jgi:hypothetical protein
MAERARSAIAPSALAGFLEATGELRSGRF